MNGDVGRSEPEPPSLPRKMKLERGTEGYGFNLHGEKGIHGQFISAIDDGSPAKLHDVRVGDRVIAVNEEDVEDFAHSKVVEKIRAGGNTVTLLVVDDGCDEYYKKLGVKIPQDNFVAVVPKDSVAAPENIEQVATNGQSEVHEEVVQQQNGEVVETESAPEPVSEEKVHEVDEKLVSEEDKSEVNVEGEDDAYEEVIPLSTPKESVPEVLTTNSEAVVVEEHTAVIEEKVQNINTTTTTTTTTVETKKEGSSLLSNDLDMAAARPKPKRNEVKRTTQNWKQKYEDFNKL